MSISQTGFPDEFLAALGDEWARMAADLAPEAELGDDIPATSGIVAAAAPEDPTEDPADTGTGDTGTGDTGTGDTGTGDTGTGTGGTGGTGTDDTDTSGTGGTGTGDTGTSDTGTGTGTGTGAGAGASSGGTLTVDGGRVTTIEVGGSKPVAAVEILNGPNNGNLTVNPDLSLALVLSGSDFSGADSFDIKITYADGTTETQTTALDVSVPTQDAGWGLGQHYMLETDAGGDLVIETGDNHRKVYVTASEEALSRADIAALEGLTEAEITTDWLIANPEYGGSEGMALDTEAGMAVWYGLTNNTAGEPSSHWLLFEKGHTYAGTQNLIAGKASGESPLQPLYVSSWGTGDRPLLNDRVKIFHAETQNIVFDDVEFGNGMFNFLGDNVIMNDLKVSGQLMHLQGVSGNTLRDSEIAHIVEDAPDADFWFGRVTGLFADDMPGLLLDGNIFHHNGWEDDFRQDGSTAGGMPPTMFSHNIYLQNTTTDVTFRNNITSQGASFGAHIRGGGFVEDNVFLDNNAAVDILGGIYQDDGAIGNFTLFADNLITSAGYKVVDYGIGALALGLHNKAHETVLLDNIIAHLADPNDPDDIAKKLQTNRPLLSESEADYDNTIIYNWIGSDPMLSYGGIVNNTPGLDVNLANQTTIQNYAAALLNKPGATIGELMDYLISLADTAADDTITADDIIAWFQAGFGVEASGDGSATMHRFIPSELAGGIRWDNRVNWDNEELPDAGDSVDLGGNFVQYGGTTVLEDLELAGGRLYVNHGKLTVTDDLNTKGGPALVQTLNAGQFWTDGYDGARKLKVDVDGGRFANTGDITGKIFVEITDGQAILAMDGGNFILGGDSQLSVVGSTAKVGFDGQSGGLAVLTMEDGSLLTFAADAAGFSTIGEFRSGAFDQTGTPVTSGVALNGTLKIDLTDYAGGADSFDLIAVDTILGHLDDVEFVGLASDLNARVIVNYKTDTVSLNIFDGHGIGSVKTIGDTVLEGGTSYADTSADLILA